MTTIKAKTREHKNLGGNGQNIKRGKFMTGRNRLKYTPVGYLRAKKSSGHKYYFYCEAVKQPDGTFSEQCEYLGTARSVLDAVRVAKTVRK
jgi:hypothetical protein